MISKELIKSEIEKVPDNPTRRALFIGENLLSADRERRRTQFHVKA